MGKVKLTGKELIETLNKDFIGKFLSFDVNNVFWTSTLELKEKREFGTVYKAKGVCFYIIEEKEYFYSFEHEAFLTIKEV